MPVRKLPADRIDFPTFSPIAAAKGDVFDLSSHRRAREALDLGLAIADDGFNIFVVGEDRSGRMSATLEYLKSSIEDRPAAPDWVYFNNFRFANRPRPCALPPGRGRELAEAVSIVIRTIRISLSKAFEDGHYVATLKALSRGAQTEFETALAALRQKAKAAGLDVVQNEQGISVVQRDAEGNAVDPQQLPEDARNRLQEAMAGLEHEFGELARQASRMQANLAQRIEQLNRRVAEAAIDELLKSLTRQFEGHPAVARWLAEMRTDILDNLDAVRAAAAEGNDGLTRLQQRYDINLLVDHGDTSSPEVVLEPNPTYGRLFGQIEYRQEQGSMSTDYSMIRAGALHRANNGILVLRAEAIAREPGVWDALKGALRDREIRIEEPQRAASLPIAGAPRPKPIPLSVKVVLIGSPHWYFSFFAVDPDLQTYFKTKADIDPDMTADAGNVALYAEMIRRTARQRLQAKCSDQAIDWLLGFSARRAGHRERLSARFEVMSDILTEAAEHIGGSAKRLIDGAAVLSALNGRHRRNARIEDRLHEDIRSGLVMIETRGTAVGQINALTVRDMGDHVFGMPARVTARASMGRRGLVNIERDVALGGPIQQKGVMVLQGFMAGHFARRRPVSFNCSLTFEQSYGGVEGDSASLAELLAVLSDLAGVPLRQDVAVTGSVNQLGQVQAVGGVLYKVEGFFHTCLRAGGLTGGQGVLLPAANEAHLVLMPDVAEAVAAGQFHIWSARTVEEAIELMTGLPAGAPDAEQRYAEGTVYGAAAAQLAHFDEALSARAIGLGEDAI